MKRKLKIFIIAGEVSGDILGAKIMRELSAAASTKTLRRDSRGSAEIEFIGIGGENMQTAGLKSLFPISDLAVMGIFEVLAHARALTARINQTVAAIIESKPDVVLTIDAPGFAKRVIKKIKSEVRNQKSEIKFYHIVAPQVWAWGARRAKKFAKIFDRLYAFFDFEAPYFTKFGMPVVVVGHPIADGLRKIVNHKSKIKNIALIPGSRMSEVKKLLPIFKQVAEFLCPPAVAGVVARRSAPGGYKFFIPVVETTKEYIEKETSGWPVRPALVPASERYEMFAETDVAVAASGTVSVELAIMHIPAVVVYKMNPLTMLLGRLLIKIKWVSLVNILLNKTVYPELLGAAATPENIVREVKKLSSLFVREKMISGLISADKMWHRNKPAARMIAESILSKM